MKKLIDFIVGMPLGYFAMWLRLKLVLYVWSCFCAGLFGLQTLPTRPTFGILFLVSLVMFKLHEHVREEQKLDAEQDTPAVFWGLASILVTLHWFIAVWFFSRFIL